MKVYNFNCVNCGRHNSKELHNGYKQFESCKNHFCNFKCKGEWQKENLKGKNNPFFGSKHSKETIKKLKNYERTIEHKNKLSETKKRLFSEGKLKPHNKEKTKENYEPLKIQSERFKGEGNPMFGKRGIQNPNYGRKCSEETKKKISRIRIKNESAKLEKNPFWKGGISFEPYTKEFNLRFKNLVRKRDNQICMLCGIHREKLKEALSVHHINYDKKLSIPQNCISLCRDCHRRTNSNRKHFVNFFQSLLEEKYGYKYENNLIVYDLMEVKK